LSNANLSAVLKRGLIISSGYTGYMNAKFGQIQVNERIIKISREFLMQVKELAENMDLELHPTVSL